jgi:hypothetical protein
VRLRRVEVKKMSPSSDHKKENGSDVTIVDRFKRHWFPSIFVLCSAVAVATWAVEYQVVVSPLNSKIDDLRREVEAKNSQTESAATISQIILEPTYLTKKSSVQTHDGSCLIRVDDIYQFEGQLAVALSVTVGSATTPFNNTESGKRLTVSTQNAVYYVDIVEIQERDS